MPAFHTLMTKSNKVAEKFATKLTSRVVYDDRNWKETPIKRLKHSASVFFQLALAAMKVLANRLIALPHDALQTKLERARRLLIKHLPRFSEPPRACSSQVQQLD